MFWNTITVLRHVFHIVYYQDFFFREIFNRKKFLGWKMPWYKSVHQIYSHSHYMSRRCAWCLGLVWFLVPFSFSCHVGVVKTVNFFFFNFLFIYLFIVIVCIHQAMWEITVLSTTKLWKVKYISSGNISFPNSDQDEVYIFAST